MLIERRADSLCVSLLISYLLLKGGLQVNGLVAHQELLGDLGLWSRLVSDWSKLDLANHQTTRVPITR